MSLARCFEHVRLALVFVLLGSSPALAQDGDLNSREQKSLRDLIYPEASVLPDYAAIRNAFEKAVAQDPSCVPSLSGMLSHSNDYVAMAAGRALGRFASPAVAQLLKQTIATEARGMVRGGAVLGLARMRDADAVQVARAALEDPDANVQAGAMGALQELGDPANSAPLLSLFDRNPDGSVLEAVGSLGDLPGSTLVRDRLVQEAFKKTNDEEIRIGAAYGLRKLGRNDLAQPLFDYNRAKAAFQSVMVVEHAVRVLAATRDLVINSQAIVDVLLRDALASDRQLATQDGIDPWKHAMRAKFIKEGEFHVISDGPDGSPGTPDDISRTESTQRYLARVFPNVYPLD